MYEIKPIFDRSSIQVDLPACMYKMKNINDITLNQSQQSGAPLTNGFNGAVSELSAKSLPDISHQIEKCIKVFIFLIHITQHPLHECTQSTIDHLWSGMFVLLKVHSFVFFSFL